MGTIRSGRSRTMLLMRKTFNWPFVCIAIFCRSMVSKISACSELNELVGKANIIYHLAAAVGVDLVVRSPIHVLQTNLHETEVLLEAASTKKVPVLLSSTSEVYGKSQRTAFSEEDDLL